MNGFEEIIIADSSNRRSEEMERLALGITPHVEMFDFYRATDQVKLVAEIGARVDALLKEGKEPLLVTNCIVGVKFGLFEAVHLHEARNSHLIRKVLLTCKSDEEVRSGFAERGLSLEGIEHVVWNALDTSHHQTRMKSIFRGE